MIPMKKATAKSVDIDPSIYQYDEVYDEIKQETPILGRETKNNSADSGPKYISGLLRNAELRKKDKERRQFRRYAREREDEEDNEEFKGKDNFVTSAYQKKLKDIERLEEERNKRQKLEDEKLSNLQNHLNRHNYQPPVKKQVEADNTKVSFDESIVPSGSKVGRNDHIPDKLEKFPETGVQDEIPLTNPISQPIDRRKVLEEKLAKRTVGNVFEDALARYLMRKSSKLNT